MTYDLLFKVICDFEDQIQTNPALILLIWNIEGQTVKNHSMYSNIMLVVVLIGIVSKNVTPLMIIPLRGEYSTALVLVKMGPKQVCFYSLSDCAELH